MVILVILISLGAWKSLPYGFDLHRRAISGPDRCDVVLGIMNHAFNRLRQKSSRNVTVQCLLLSSTCGLTFSSSEYLRLSGRTLSMGKTLASFASSRGFVISGTISFLDAEGDGNRMRPRFRRVGIYFAPLAAFSSS